MESGDAVGHSSPRVQGDPRETWGQGRAHETLLRTDGLVRK